MRDRPRGGPAGPLAWIERAPGAPYFRTRDGADWTPIGQNDSIAWSDLAGLWRRRDLPAVEGHMRWLAGHGVTCLRVMLEDAQTPHRYFERPIGVWNAPVVAMWDDLVALCERIGLRLLVTPFDTFWTWIRWSRHPYNIARGGVLDGPDRMLLDAGAREAIKARLAFATRRWGASGAIFAWDLWNEIHPAQAQDSADPFVSFIDDLSRHLRALEIEIHGAAHPQTVSLFGPELRWRPDMALAMAEPVFRHPLLDFANLHVYQEGAIDDPRDTVEAGLAMGRIVRASVAEIVDGRPFFDSEHGPIHLFKDKKVTLPEAFDDEYFRLMQWAHLAAGGAGGGMRWPNRHPHVLTHGMRRAQKGLADFLPLVEWQRFDRADAGARARLTRAGRLHSHLVSERKVAMFSVASRDQAVAWMVRRDATTPDGRIDTSGPGLELGFELDGLAPGAYAVTAWDTRAGAALATMRADVAPGGPIVVTLPPLAGDMALAVTPACAPPTSPP